MGSIKSGLFISLDGVIEAPETWHFDYWNDEMGAAVGALMEGGDAMLLGRTTYEGFAGYWPTADPDDPMTKQMNSARKYVVSNTLTEATWENSTIVSGDVKAELTRLKQDQHLATTGSAVLVQWMVEQGLVDELHLLVHPVVVGSGQKLFADGAKVPLQLLSSTTFETGVVHLVYGPAAR
ncbi:MAG TPA: dihydrofolate reductase family protein [Pseudonocardia sp.]|jgi:dihydrofolate reductase|uniref:dihydrofolate reductase family protein n=1 Tax=Pseudonocardia sp. TaxID=60912 RepID=UPI002B4AF8E4|nr:dihydrofolate reductase family protein [Pseudonocardia sp.]HLU57653.1 dihydrofolate reductase family protein [Pseudonocardia sp.]